MSNADTQPSALALVVPPSSLLPGNIHLDFPWHNAWPPARFLMCHCFKFASSPKTGPTMPDLLHHPSLLVVRQLFTQWNVIFCVSCSPRRRVSRSASSHIAASEYWPRLNLLLMTLGFVRLFNSPQRTASSLSTSMTLLRASVTLIMPCAYGDSNSAMTTMSADSPAFSVRKSSGHYYATGHGFGASSGAPNC